MKYLFLIDLQNDFINFTFGTPEAQAIVPKVIEKIENFEGQIVYTEDVHIKEEKISIEEKRLPEHCIVLTEGWKIDQNIKKALNDKHVIGITKGTFGLNNDALLELFENMWNPELGEDDIEICGLCTDICVITNALALRTMFPNNVIKVDASCCAGSTPEKHKAALEVMKSCLIDVINE